MDELSFRKAAQNPVGEDILFLCVREMRVIGKQRQQCGSIGHGTPPQKIRKSRRSASMVTEPGEEGQPVEKESGAGEAAKRKNHLMQWPIRKAVAMQGGEKKSGGAFRPLGDVFVRPKGCRQSKLLTYNTYK